MVSVCHFANMELPRRGPTSHLYCMTLKGSKGCLLHPHVFVSGYQPAGYTPDALGPHDSITMRLLQECGPVCILNLAYRFVSHANFVEYLFLEQMKYWRAVYLFLH